MRDRLRALGNPRSTSRPLRRSGARLRAREPGRPVEVETVAARTAPARRGARPRAASGVCHSDVRLADGTSATAAARRCSATRARASSRRSAPGVERSALGDHVALCLVPSCGVVRRVPRGLPTLCEPAGASSVAGGAAGRDARGSRGRRDGPPVLVDGLLLRRARASSRRACAIPIPADVPLWQAALLGCAVVTGVGAVAHAAGVRPGDRVCVIGCGGVGLHVIAGARLAGARRRSSPSTGGATSSSTRCAAGRRTRSTRPGADPEAEIRELAGGGVDYAFEASGAPATIRMAWDSLRAGRRGRRRRAAPRGRRVCRCRRSSSVRERRSGAATTARRIPSVTLPWLIDLVRSGRLQLGGWSRTCSSSTGSRRRSSDCGVARGRSAS